MTLTTLIKELQKLETKIGGTTDIEICIEPDPLSTVNEADAIANSLAKTESFNWKDEQCICLYFDIQ